MSGDRQRGATIRRSIMADTALDLSRDQHRIYFGGWGGWGWGGWGWGWGPNWFGGSVFVNGGFFNRYGYRGGLYAGGFAGRAAWQHDAGHRLGVSYPNRQLAARYGAASLASRSAMTRSGSLNSTRSAGTGNWNRFGSGTASAYGNRSVTQSARSTAPQSAGRATEGQWQHFQGAQRNQAPAQRYSAPAQRTFGSGAAIFGSSAAILGSSAAVPICATNVRTELQRWRPQRWGRRRLTRFW